MTKMMRIRKKKEEERGGGRRGRRWRVHAHQCGVGEEGRRQRAPQTARRSLIISQGFTKEGRRRVKQRKQKKSNEEIEKEKSKRKEGKRLTR